MGTWKRFWSLDRSDRRVVVELAALIVVTRAALRIAGYRRWMSIVSFFFPPDPTDQAIQLSSKASEARAVSNRIARLNAGAARRLFFRPTCLERSIGLWWVLRRRGIDAEVHIGGRKAGGQFEAHAWVECAGAVLNDPSDEYRQFIPFGAENAIAARQLH